MFPSGQRNHRASTLELLGLTSNTGSISSSASLSSAAVHVGNNGAGNLSTALLGYTQLQQSLRTRTTAATNNPFLNLPIEQKHPSADEILAAAFFADRRRQQEEAAATAQLLQAARSSYGLVPRLDGGMAALVQQARNNALSSQQPSLDLKAMNTNPVGLSLTDKVRQHAMVNEAFQRGREEAILCLLRSGAVDKNVLKRHQLQLQQPNHQPSSAAAASPPTDFHKMPTVTSLDLQNENKNTTNRGALETIGTLRKKNSPYFDASFLADPDAAVLANRRTRGGVTEPFPEKLHRLIRDAEANGESDVISFFSHGRAFAIHHEERFCREIMPRYFRQSRFSSFQRQLNLYGFTRITNGPDARGYYHELFLKSRPALVIHMRRVGFPKSNPPTSSSAAGKPAANPNPSISPDFYSMPAIKSGEETSKEESK